MRRQKAISPIGLRQLFACSLLLFIQSGFYAAYAQDTLPEVTVFTARWSNFNDGQLVHIPDSTTLQLYNGLTLTDLLSDHVVAFTRNYSPGQLASPSVRGTSAYHTPILWNGFNIQSPMLGQYDLSLIPVSAFDQIGVQYGGGSATFGSGAVGGIIYLNNQPGFNNGFSSAVTAHTGSFGFNRYSVSISQGTKKLYSKSTAIRSGAVNDFDYINIYELGFPVRKQSHAAWDNLTFLQDFGINFGKAGELILHGWFSKNDREIPPLMSETSSSAKQWDETIRLAGRYSYSHRKYSLHLRQAYFREFIQYQNTLINVDDRNLANTSITEMDQYYRFNSRHLLHIGLHFTHNRAKVPSYISDHVEQNRAAVFVSYKYSSKNGRLNSHLSVRQEWMEKKMAPLIPELRVSWKASKLFSIDALLNRNFRFPTLNEMYWQPGGNPDLKPELGWNKEATISINPFRKPTLRLSATAYHSIIENWVVWTPQAAYVVPLNIKTVNSQGLETGINVHYNVKRWRFAASSYFTAAQSTTIDSYDGDPKVIGKQLIYTPQFLSRSMLRLGYWDMTLQYQHQFNSWRYTTNDNSRYLSGYYVSQLMASYTCRLKSISLVIQAQVNNLFNENYVVIPNRAMPGRNFQSGIIIQFNKPTLK